MRALVARPAEGGARLAVEEIAEPSVGPGDLLVEGVAVGVCGTDRRLLRHPPRGEAGRDCLVIGHESLGRVLQAPDGSGFAPGDLVAGIVRRPDPGPCRYCAAGESDRCETDGFTERGILGRDGFAAERYCLEAEYAVHVDAGLGLAGVLLEPASVVAKGWEKLDRLAWGRRGGESGRVLVTGAGPIGMLSALLAIQRGHEVHVVDRVVEGLKPTQVEALGATYHSTPASLPGGFDAVMECSGMLIGEAVRQTAAGGAICLVAGDERDTVAPGELHALTGDLVSRNKLLVGTINANRRHFDAAHDALRRAEPAWLEGLVGLRVPLEGWRDAFEAGPEQIKAVIDLDGGAAR